ncbi:hypothetical protein GS506_12215 [Rhodococcus hoagii]|nr:hypothetical protein [Prescottella equi]
MKEVRRTPDVCLTIYFRNPAADSSRRGFRRSRPVSPMHGARWLRVARQVQGPGGTVPVGRGPGGGV